MPKPTMPAPCGCGCGDSAEAGNKFIHGHWSRTDQARAMYMQRRKSKGGSNPTGLCGCGCGCVTPIAKEARPERGYYTGEHVRFLKGHGQRNIRGEHSKAWKGGRVVTPSGYVYLYAPEHPHTNARGYIYEHRAVVEKRLGRVLDTGERVHHLNHNRGDNRDENLILFPSHQAHVKAEHAAALKEWGRRNPLRYSAAQSKAGKKGASARWGKK